MPLTTGQSLSFYEILGPPGASWMGEVYRGRDTRLERQTVPDLHAKDGRRHRVFWPR